MELRKFTILTLLALVLVGVMPLAAQDATAEATACEEGFRLIVHALGETCVPENPQRVTVIDQGVTLEHFVALGVQPLSAPLSNTMADYVRSGLSAEVLDHGTSSEPNLESILASAPDLIIGWNAFITPELYETLSNIAPTVATPRVDFSDWREDLVFVADVLNIPEKADEVLAEYDERIQSIQEALAAEEPVTISSIGTWSTNIRLESEGSFSNPILAAVGLERPAAQIEFISEYPDKLSWGQIDISIEEIIVADADHIFLLSYSASPDDEQAETEANLLNHPLWQQLEAVKAGNVHIIVGDVWLQGSVIGAHFLLDDLATYLLEAESSLPNPYAYLLAEVTPEATEAPSS